MNLQLLMGGGGSFSAGGPGKGMHSRLCMFYFGHPFLANLCTKFICYHSLFVHVITHNSLMQPNFFLAHFYHSCNSFLHVLHRSPGLE